MAFCKQCGTDLNGAKFCPGCGAAADGNVPAQQGYVGVPVGADVRQRSLHDMEHMMKYFGAKKKQYDEFDRVSAEVADRQGRTNAGWLTAGIVCLLIALFSKSVFFYIAAAAMVALFILFKKQNKDKLTVALKRQDALGKDLAAYYEAYGYCPVGLEYTKPSTLEALYDLIRKGRASNPSDAIKIYLADLDREKMLKLQEETAEAAKQTAKNSKKAARYASANFWFK